MKTSILTHSIAALLLALPAARAAADDKAPEKKQDGHSSSASTSVIATGDGTATITIDINGKKETRTFKLGDGNQSFSFSTDDGGGVVVGGGGFAGAGGPAAQNVKRAKGPWIGIAMEPVPDVVRAQLPLAAGEGVVVNHVMPDSPAAKAGLEPNDILLRFDDQIIVEPSQLRKLIAMKKPGDSVKLSYMRKGERKDTSAVLIEHELEPDRPGPMQWLQGMPRWQGGDDAMRRLEEQLKQLREKRPGVIIDKWSWFGGPDGAMNRERFKGMLDEMRKQLENSKLPKEEQEKIRKNVEEAIESARKAVEDAMKDVRRWRKDDDGKQDEKPKKPGEPL